MAAYNTSSSLGQQLALLMNHIIAAKQTADRLSGDFAAMETNGGVSDSDYAAIQTAMSIADDATAHGLVFLVTDLQTKLAAAVADGGFYKWDPSAN